MTGQHLAPFAHDAGRSRHAHRDMLLTTIPLCLLSCINYGFRPLLLVLTGILTAVSCECIAAVLMHRSAHLHTGAGAAIGAMIGLLMSPIAPYWIPFVGAIFAVLIVKIPFGGSGRYVFNPVAGGMAFVTLLYQGSLFVYPSVSQSASLPLGNLIADLVTTATSPVALLRDGASGNHRWWELLTGQMPGPIGATAALVLLAAAVFLFFRRSSSPLVFFSYLFTCAVFALLFPRTEAEWYTGLAMELFSGYLLFAGVYLLGDPSTAPRYWLARIVYGLLAGVLVMLVRYFGQFEEGAAFAILLVNPLSTLLDRGCWKLVYAIRSRVRKGAAV